MPKSKKATTDSAAQARKKPGRQPMTAAEKKEAAKKRAEEIKLAANMVPALILQYQGNDVDLQDQVEKAKAAFKEQHKRTRITDMKLYFKPEEHATYYVINGTFDGKIDQ